MHGPFAEGEASREASPSPVPPEAAREALMCQIGLLAAIVDEENALLRARRFDGLVATAARKERALAELRRLARSIDADRPEPALGTRVATLKRSLQVNLAMLGSYQSALRELAGAMDASAAARESDGTYRRGAAGAWGAR